MRLRKSTVLSTAYDSSARIPRDGFLYEKRTEAYPALGINGEKGLLDR